MQALNRQEIQNVLHAIGRLHTAAECDDNQPAVATLDQIAEQLADLWAAAPEQQRAEVIDAKSH